MTRVAREVGTEASSAARPRCRAWRARKDLTDNVNLMASNLTGQVHTANVAEVSTAIAGSDLSKKKSP